MYKFSNYAEIISSINPDEPLMFDTETIGLYGKIRLAQFYQRGWPKVLFIDRPKPFELLSFLSSISHVELVLQNSPYDVSTIQEQTGSRFVPTNFQDTFFLARLALPRLESFALDDLMEAVLGYDPYKKYNIVKSEMQKSNWASLILTDKQCTYAAIDVYHLPDVYDKVKSFKDDISYKLDMHNVRKALDFQNNGMPVLLDRVEATYESNVIELAKLAMPINVNSWQQVRPYVNGGSDALELATLALQGNVRASTVLKAKRLLKQNSFLDKFSDPEGRIYGKFSPSARSGRYTCKDQNLQQLPRKLKHCFGVQPGRVLLYADYPQLELRTIAAIANEHVLIELFKSGGDPHNYVAKMLFGANWTKDDRQVVKTYNFNLLYCGGAAMVQSIFIKDHNVWRELDVIKREARRWKSAWPAINAWQEETIRSHRRGAIKQTPFGRRYVGRLLTDHANIENQGFGAEIAKLALHYMYDDLKANNALLCNFIHDSFHVEMDEDPVENRKVAKIMRTAMQDAWSEGCKMVKVHDIPMPAKVDCGYNWADIEAGNYIFREG